MNDYTQEEIETRYQKLPEPLKDALFSTDVAYKIFDTGKKYGMSIDQIGSIADEVGYVILGLTRPSEFIANLRGRLGVSTDVARDVASEINHAVFAALRTILRATHHIEVSDEEIMRPAPILPKKPVVPLPPPAPAKPLPQNPPKPPVRETQKPSPPQPPPPQIQIPKNTEVPTFQAPTPPKQKPPQENATTPETEEEEVPPWVIQEEKRFGIAPNPASNAQKNLPQQPIKTEQKSEHPIPSWIREQEERKTAPVKEDISKKQTGGDEKKNDLSKARFTLDLRDRKPPSSGPPAAEAPPKPPWPPSETKKEPTKTTVLQREAPPEIASVIKDEPTEKEPPQTKTNPNPEIKSVEMPQQKETIPKKPKPVRTPGYITFDPYREQAE